MTRKVREKTAGRRHLQGEEYQGYVYASGPGEPRAPSRAFGSVRIFDFDAVPGATFLVRYPDREIIVSPRIISVSEDVKTAGFIEISFGDVRPQFIEVIALDSHERFWAYATKRDNVTNHITAISPD